MISAVPLLVFDTFGASEIEALHAIKSQQESFSVLSIVAIS